MISLRIGSCATTSQITSPLGRTYVTAPSDGSVIVRTSRPATLAVPIVAFSMLVEIRGSMASVNPATSAPLIRSAAMLAAGSVPGTCT